MGYVHWVQLTPCHFSISELYVLNQLVNVYEELKFVQCTLKYRRYSIIQMYVILRKVASRCKLLSENVLTPAYSIGVYMFTSFFSITLL